VNKNKSNRESDCTDARKWPQKLIINNCDETFCFLDDFSVLLCKQHRTPHLRKYHPASAALRRQIIESFSTFNAIPPSTFKSPEEPAQPIEELGKLLDGA
jgi:hypothetical protein